MSGRLVSLKIDSATRLSRSIFGISAQFMRDDKMHSIILGMIELKGKGSSSAKNLAIEILNTMSKYQLNLNQIVSVTSDNGANMLKSTKILSCCNTFFNDDSEDSVFSENNETYISIINDMQDFPELKLGEIKICRCAAHTAQLCALDTLKDAEVKKYILECRNLTKYCRKSSSSCRTLFEMKKLKIPKLDCPTRWGSTYLMLRSLNEARCILEGLGSLKTDAIEEGFENNKNLWEFISSYCIVFEPLQKAIIKFQEEQLHYGDFYAEWLICQIFTKKIVENEETSNTFTYKIGTLILNSVSARTKKLQENDCLKSCLFLDPRFHHTLDKNQKSNAISYLKTLWDKISQISSKDKENTATFLPINIFTNERDAMLNDFLTKGMDVDIQESSPDIMTKLETLQLPYSRSDTNVLNFWKEKKYSNPELYALSNVCFAVPPTQVTIERAFSSLKLILADNRSRLSHENLENILLVKLNSNYIDDAVQNLPLFEDSDN